MKKILLFIGAFLLIANGVCFSSDETTKSDFYDFDFKFIDNPFSGQKMVTDEEYQKTLERYQQNNQKKKNRGFWNWVFKHTLPEDQQYTPPDNTRPSTYSDEIKFQKEMLSQKPTIALSDSVIDSRGREVKEGFYQVTCEDSKLKLIQGYDTIGIFDARKATDNWEENKIIYARVVYQEEDVVKIIYSNLDDCFEAYAYVKKN